jgi:hypothetical protein
MQSSLGVAKSSLGDAESSLGDAKSSLGDAKSSLGDARYMPEAMDSARYGKGSAVRFGQAKSGADISAELNRSVAKQKRIKDTEDEVPGPGHYKARAHTPTLVYRRMHRALGGAQQRLMKRPAKVFIIRHFCGFLWRSAVQRGQVAQHLVRANQVQQGDARHRL